MEVTEAGIVTPSDRCNHRGTIPDGGDRGRYRHTRQTAATIEGRLPDGGDRGRYRHPSDRCNTGSIIPDGGDR